MKAFASLCLLLLLLINLIKRPRIIETAFPDLVYDFGGMNIVFDTWARHHCECGAAADAVLELLGYAPLVLCEEFAGEAAFT